MRFGSTAKVLAECKLKYYRMLEWDGISLGDGAASRVGAASWLDRSDARDAVRASAKLACALNGVLKGVPKVAGGGVGGWDAAEACEVVEVMDGTGSVGPFLDQRTLSACTPAIPRNQSQITPPPPHTHSHTHTHARARARMCHHSMPRACTSAIPGIGGAHQKEHVTHTHTSCISAA